MLKSGMSSPVSYDLQGQGGGVVVDSSNPGVGSFRWIQVINDATIDEINADGGIGTIANEALLSGLTIPAGIGIGGRFIGVSVTSGVVIAYYA